MNRDGKIGFKSYDRFFPNQDTLPEGGLGNLVALPLQGNARKNGNSVFVNEFFEPYPDQWQYLLNVEKLSEQALEELLKQNENSMPLGDLSKTSESKPWEVPVANKIERTDFASEIVITRSNMLYIPLSQLSSKVLNHLRRIASFRNPEFYSKQALRLSTYSTPRIISCAELTAGNSLYLIGGGSLNANGGNGGFGGAASNIGTGVAAASRSPHAQACILIMV